MMELVLQFSIFAASFYLSSAIGYLFVEWTEYQ